MKGKIEQLIQQHRLAKDEVNNLLEELNQIDSSKLSYQEVDSLEVSKVKLLEEIYLRSVFVTDLESLL